MSDKSLYVIDRNQEIIRFELDDDIHGEMQSMTNPLTGECHLVAMCQTFKSVEEAEAYRKSDAFLNSKPSPIQVHFGEEIADFYA